VKEAEGSVCQHFQRAAEVLGRRWNPQIVRVLLGGPHRFGEIRNAIPGISDHLLSERLKQLEAEGIVRREVIDDRPVRIEYALTEAGADLQGAIGALGVWAERWEGSTASGAQSRSAAGGRSR
jgi:DNA-binding HxlR family transcriptional regulator